jgi:(p)ppGpp synthase/HD superfamily hydrolase
MDKQIKNHGRWFAEQAHRAVNHMYDDGLPYEYHLRMAVEAAEQFVHLLPPDDHVRASVFAGVWNHDTIEDTHVTYGQLKKEFGILTAEIVFALTNNKGRNRKERANAAYYEGIRNTKHATFAKLCDRIANVTFGKIFGGKLDMFRDEQGAFEEALNGAPVVEDLDGSTNMEFVRCFPMVLHLRELLS